MIVIGTVVRTVRKQKVKKKRAIVFFLLFILVIGVDIYVIRYFMKEDSVIVSTADYLAEDTMLNEANKDNSDGKVTKDKKEDVTKEGKNKVLLDVPFINQTKDYLNACESISAVMALQYLGIDITVDDFITDYLDKGVAPYRDKHGVYRGSNPWEKFPGNPKDDTGWGCYAPVIVNALNKFIDKDKYDVQELYNEKVSSLCSDYIDHGVPVIFWATIDMKAPSKGSSWKLVDSDEKFTWIRPMHCVLLVGYDDNYYYFNDPWVKKAYKYKKAEVERAYKGLYQQAVVVTKIKK